MTRARISTGDILLIAALVVLPISLGALNPVVGIGLLGAGTSFAATFFGPSFARAHEGRRRLVRLIQMGGALAAGLAVFTVAAAPVLASIVGSIVGTPSAGLPYLYLTMILVVGATLLFGAQWVRNGYRRE